MFCHFPKNVVVALLGAVAVMGADLGPAAVNAVVQPSVVAVLLLEEPLFEQGGPDYPRRARGHVISELSLEQGVIVSSLIAS